jgi:WXG100 family type VII secretion target
MAKAHVDPGELRRFARDLTRFNHEVEQLLGALYARTQNLQRTWQDQEQKKFMEEFEQTIKALRRFLETSEAHITFLGKKAQYIDDYLQQH